MPVFLRKPANTPRRAAVCTLAPALGLFAALAPAPARANDTLSGFATEPDAPPRVLLLDTQLQTTPARLLRAGPSAVRVEDANADGRIAPRELDPATLLRIERAPVAPGPAFGPAPDAHKPPSPPAGAAELTLVDGQRLLAIPHGPAPDDPNRLRVDLYGLSTVLSNARTSRPDPAQPRRAVAATVALDRIHAIHYTPGEDPFANAPATPGDAVRLRNGELLTGFVDFDPDGGLSLSPDGADAPVPLDPAVIAGVRLANPPADRAPGAHRVSLSVSRAAPIVIDVSDWSYDSGTLRVSLPDTPGDLGPAIQLDPPRIAELTADAQALRRVDLHHPGYRLTPWADLPWLRADNATVFGVTFDPRVDAHGHIHANAPAVLRFDAPTGLRGLTGVVRLDLTGANATALKLAGVTVFLEPANHTPPTDPDADRSLDPERTWSAELTAEQPQARFALPMTGDWVLRLDPGRGGPIFDRVVVQDAQALVQTPR
ncbi:MAG: hypothetical protein AAF288_12060 [Planctomycetota bacterium]